MRAVAPDAPARRAGRELGPGEDQHEDRHVARPVDEVVEEVEQAGVGVLDVLDQQHDRARSRPAARRTAASRRTAPRGGSRAAVGGERHAEQPRRARSRRSSRSAGSGTNAASPSPACSAATSAGPPRRCPSRCRTDLGERPERDAVAVGQAAAAVPAHVVGQAVDVLLELPAEPRLADAGRAGHDDQPRRRRRPRAWNSSLISAQLGVAADQRRLEAVDALRCRRRRTARASAATAATGSALPFSSCSPASSKPTAAAASRCGRRRRPGPCPASAADCTRAAVLTASPATMPSPIAPSVTATSPVTTPARAASSGAPTRRPSCGHRVDRSSAGADGALGVALVRDRRAPDRHHGVADELLDHAAVALDHRAGALEVARQQLAHLLGVARLGQRGEADEVEEQHRADPALGHRRCAAGAAYGAAAAGAVASKRGAALAAERCRGPGSAPQDGQAWLQRRAALAAELGGDGVGGAAGRAGRHRASSEDRFGRWLSLGCAPRPRAALSRA